MNWRMSPSTAAFTLALLGLGAAGGGVLAIAGLPMPFMLGSLAVTAVAVGVGETRFPTAYVFPQSLRLVFIGVIGVMIGAQVDPALISQIPSMAVSLLGVGVFVLLAHGVNYRILRGLGGYDVATAYYSGAPGGLIESIALGEEAGGDVRVLTLMQFLRIIVVVSVVPLLLSLWEGRVVGSAAGLSFGRESAGLSGIPMVLVVGLLGLLVGKFLRLPAWRLVGPLVVAAVLSATGLVALSAPGWLISVAQVVLGVSLGLRFAGLNRAMLVKGLTLSVISVGAMLVIGILMALVISRITGLPLDVLMISFAPGGVTEMSLIALSLSANPAFVTLHHLFRITLTVVSMTMIRRLGIVRM